MGPANETSTFSLSEVELLPDGVFRILVYAYNTLHDIDPLFWRGYYQIYTETEDGDLRYQGYMNTANPGTGATIDSVNIWLPYGPGIKDSLFVKLTTYYEESPEARAVHNSPFQLGEVFITGYYYKP